MLFINTLDNSRNFTDCSLKLSILIAEYIKGVDRIWICGDDFGFKSFNKYYCLQDQPKDHFMEERLR